MILHIVPVTTPNVTRLATSPIGSSPAGLLKTVTIGGYTYTVATLDLQKEQYAFRVGKGEIFHVYPITFNS